MKERTIRFTKMHGAGNDYIYVNTMLYNLDNPAELSQRWSKPHTGIGADGLVLIGSPHDSQADFSMRIFNADGSEAMMCGNASRCVGKYLFEKGLTDKTEIRLETLSGVKLLYLDIVETPDGTKSVSNVLVDMLEPRFFVLEQFAMAAEKPQETELSVGDRLLKGLFVSMGNPHFVVFVNDVEHLDLERYGQLMEHHPAFPQRCNIEFAEVIPASEGSLPDRIRMRVWERGSGMTMACGTGACATAVAAAVTCRTGREAIVVMDGGELQIKWCDVDGHVYLSGAASTVFEGEIPLK